MEIYFIIFHLLILLIQASKGFKQCGGLEGQALASGAKDLAVVTQNDGSLISTTLSVHIGKLSSWQTVFKSRQGKVVRILIEGQEFYPDAKLVVGSFGSACFDRDQHGDRFTKEELSRMNLKFGPNFGSLVVSSLGIKIPFTIFLMNQSSRLVLTDVDGTITESNIRGFIYPQLGINAHQTLQDQQGFSLPRGPLFMSPLAFPQSVFEAVTDPSVTKTATLRDILELFDKKEEAVFGAYGNADTDTLAYTNVGISTNLIYLVNEIGELRKVSDGTITSYKHHADMVNDMYPK